MDIDVREACGHSADALDVLCVGESMAMVAPTTPTALESADAFELHCGGAESNVAVYLAALGHRAAWASRLGQDPLGRRVRQSIAGMRVETDMVEHVPGARTGVYFKDPRPDGTSVHYYRDGSAAAGMDRSFVARLPRTSRYVHLSGVTPALSTTCREMVEEIVVHRALGEAVVSFDVNYRAGLWSVDAAAPVLLALARRADVVLTGRDEAERLWGTASTAEIRELLQGVPTVVIKDAARDATELSGGWAWTVPALAVEVREAVGAGDAFAAGWLAGLLRGYGPVTRLRLGHVAAAAALRSTSDFGALPPASRIEEMLALDEPGWRDARMAARSDEEGGGP